MADSYFSVENISQGLYKDKGSKFISFAVPVKSVDEVNTILAHYRKEYYDARHVCYAYMLGAEREIFRSNDDGEPSGTAGKPILGQINSYNLTNVLIVVIRYFGGILLGTSGLIAAYRNAAKDAIDNARIIEHALTKIHKISFPYDIVSHIMRIIKDCHAQILNTEYQDNTQILTIEVQQAVSTACEEKLDKFSHYGLKRF